MRRSLASPTAARRTREQQERRTQQRDNDVRSVLATHEGRRFLWWLLDDVCGLHSSAFGGDMPSLTFLEGRRSVGVDVLRHAQRVAPDDYVTALQEHVHAAKEEALQREDAHAATAEEADNA